MSSKIEETIESFSNEQCAIEANKIFSELIQPEQYVGDLFSINYDKAKILVHDFYRKKVGGIPSLCFLIATRKNHNDEIDYMDEDSSIILLRVMDSVSIPQDTEAEKIRIETAQRVSGELEKHWDSKEAMDGKTRDIFGYAGLYCRIIGTFFLDENTESTSKRLSLRFGTDISNFYPNRGLKIYKPNGTALETIINYIDPVNLSNYEEEYGTTEKVTFGKVRYASTNRGFQGIDNVPAYIYPADLLAQKTALFGMTRTGKSNTTKIIAKSVYELRNSEKPIRIGQIIFDPNGEYANENTQDAKGNDNPTALKNIWELYNSKNDSEVKSRKDELVIYGLHPHNADIAGQERELMRLNFFNDDMLNNGKTIINNTLESENAQYFRNFKQVDFQEPIKENFEDEGEFWEELTRFLRRKLAYLSLLKKAGLNPPSNLRPRMKFNTTRFLFSSELRTIMSEVELSDKKQEALIKMAAETLGNEHASWDALPNAFEGLFYFLNTDEYTKYNTSYAKKSKTGQGFADSDFERILEMFKYSKGSNLIGKVIPQHDPNLKEDYAEEIYKHLLAGKLVIVDQSGGDELLNKASAKRVMSRIFLGNQQAFREGKRPKDILIYIEEAHNILPSGKDLDLSDIWVRAAKEGAKYKLGLIYATQEVSSIQKNILKNTANWFISHLNNSDETKELCKFYDFADFEPSIRRAQDKGFLRVKTLSSPFVIPVQVNKFELRIEKNV